MRYRHLVCASAPRTCTSIFGPIEYERDWWEDGEKRGFSPIDAQLGVRKNSHLSRGVRRRVTFSGAVESKSFAAASGLLQEMTGLEIDPSEIQRETELAGCDAYDEQAGRDEAYRRPEQPGESVAEIQHDILVAGMDGVFVQGQEKRRGPKRKVADTQQVPAPQQSGVPAEPAMIEPQGAVMIESPAVLAPPVATPAAPQSDSPEPPGAKVIEVPSPARKRRRQPKGSSTIFGCEIKVGMVHGMEDRARTAGGRPLLIDKRVVACDEPVEVFRERFIALLYRGGMRQAKYVVILGDGAAWIWITALTLIGTVIQVLDFWHANEYAVELAKVLFSEGSEEARQWSDTTATRLRAGEVRPVIVELVKMARNSSGTRREQLNKTIGYFFRNRMRMNYPDYERKGLPIGSGSIESLGKNLVKSRLCGSGKRWEPKGIKAVLALRELHANGDWNAFWDRDVQRILKAA